MTDPDPRWAQYMLWRLPDLDVVSDEVLRRCDRAADSVEPAKLRAAVLAGARGWLAALVVGRPEFAPAEVRPLLDPVRFDVATFTGYLSTKGATGVAVSNKLAAFLTGVLPMTLADRMRDGEFDA